MENSNYAKKIIGAFAFIVNIVVALWLGNLLGKAYYGFLIVAACYTLAGLVLLLFSLLSRAPLYNTITKQLTG